MWKALLGWLLKSVIEDAVDELKKRASPKVDPTDTGKN